MNETQKLILFNINKSIDLILKELDDNNRFINSLNIENKSKEILIKSLDKFEKSIQTFFNAQKKDYLNNIYSFFKTFKDIKWKVHKLKGDELINNIVDIMSEIIFANDKIHLERLENLYEAFTSPLISELAKICAKSIEGSKCKNNIILSKNAKDWLSTHKILFSQQVNKTTHDEIIKILRNNLSNGTTISANKLVELLPKFFNQDKINQNEKTLKNIKNTNLYNKIYQDIQRSKDFEFYRARRIARTETLTAINVATLEGYRQSEVVVGKQWECSCDERSRPWHIKANGQIVGINEPFIVMGEKLMHPCDSSMGASAKNIIMCRCGMKSITKFDKDNNNINI